MMNVKEEMVAVVEVDKKVLAKINMYLADGEDINNHQLGQEETLLSLSAKFSNGYTGKIEAFTGEYSVMATAYLYDTGGKCITYIESDEKIYGEYIFETDEGDYIVKVEEK